ncbi:hypothetical protein LY90DRAFT_508487 [Neocallimastix californiae]|uniref:Uncharacterized protein n=1 Tax=Neocallimastix californiae TaxID=1754190 RepID=A0A1Y2CWD4_9FUNG|nr:hypothetical protein LY90DRAFT_508487 [Neocallimastix californiae]|eukprot:ORY50655.1 hypothetical protein LY90DRAFT_508487 [Neocallimastix californiae]
MEENSIIDKEILKYDNSHNHPEKEYDVSLSIMKYKIKDGIGKSSIPFGIKTKSLYNKISKEMGLICPEYNSIKSQISINLNKKLLSNVTTFAEIPSESEYYKTKRGENFMIFKNSNLIIFQSPFQAKLFSEYNDDIFIDAISNLPFINPEYIFDIYVIIKIKYINNNYSQFLKFLEYFYKTYLVGYDMKIWNYYNNMEHITNNASELLNNYLNNLFPTKQSFYELIDKLNELEHLSYYDYQRKIRGIR